MFGWFRPTCPIDLYHAVRVDQYMSWLAQRFGVEPVRRAIFVRPTPEFFPEPYAGTD